MIEKTMTSHPRPRFRPLFGWLGSAAMRSYVFVAALSPAVVLTPTALAQEEEVERDARLEGYETKVSLDNDSTALMWILLVALGGLAMGVMFKNAKRTHLD